MRYIIKTTVFFVLFYSNMLAQETAKTKNVQLSHYIEGIKNPEDLITIDNSDWVIVSSMASNKESSGAICGLNKKTKKTVTLFNNNKQEGAQAQGLKYFAPHGIYLRKVKTEEYQLLVVNHGSREAIEIFSLHFENQIPKLTWEKHIDFPKNVWANGVVVDSKGTIYATSMYDPNDSSFLEKFKRKEPTGQIWEWNSEQGWKPFNTMRFSAANGIAISQDGLHLYMSEWAKQKVHEFSTVNRSELASIKLDFLPDNIRWSLDGNLIIAGQNGLPVDVFTSKGITKKNMYFSVVKIKPQSFTIQKLIEGGSGYFANATVAVELENTYLLGCVENNKIAVYNK